MSANAILNFYFSDTKPWHRELRALRAILLTTGLQEEKKWRHPVYCLDGENVANLADVKSGVRVGFFKGYLLEDPEERLTWAGPNSHQAKYLEFRTLTEIEAGEATLRAFIEAAKALVGQDIPKPMTPEMTVPEELQQLLNEDPDLATAFAALTPGRQRSYCLHISAAKTSTTRQTRAKKAKDKIMAGLGFNEYGK